MPTPKDKEVQDDDSRKEQKVLGKPERWYLKRADRAVNGARREREGVRECLERVEKVYTKGILRFWARGP